MARHPTPAPHGQGAGLVLDASKLLRKLKEVGLELDGHALLTAIGQRHLNWSGLNVQKAGNHHDPVTGAGKLWQRMAKVTLEGRRKRGDSAPSDHHFVSRYQTLLQQSLTSQVEGSSRVSVGTAARYARFHHEGSQRGAWRLPARPLVPARQAARDMAKAVMDAMHERLAHKGRA